jgi:hypothetical protein
MELAFSSKKSVIPVVLNVPFNEWPPKKIGKTTMANQFATAAGDLKIFVDMTDSASFFPKLEKELLPRLKAGPGGFKFPARDSSFIKPHEPSSGGEGGPVGRAYSAPPEATTHTPEATAVTPTPTQSWQQGSVFTFEEMPGVSAAPAPDSVSKHKNTGTALAPYLQETNL